MRRNRISMAALVFGAGLGGFIHVIALQKLLEWHALAEEAAFLSAALAGAVAGVLLLWSAFRAPGRMPSGRAFAGNLLFGWGAFNLLEGALNHHVLQTHHVRDLPAHIATYDWVFLAAGLLLVLLGLALQDAADPRPVSEERRSGLDRRDLLNRA